MRTVGVGANKPKKTPADAKLKKENEQLKSELETVKVENEQLKSELETVKVENEQLKSELEELKNVEPDAGKGKTSK